MNNGYPCPNPICSHVFPAVAVTGATVLTCPRCATVFQFQAGATPTAAPPPRVPVAQPVPVTAAPAPEPSAVDFGLSGIHSPVMLRQGAARRRPSRWSGVILASACVLGLGLALLIGLRWKSFVPERKADKTTGEELVFTGLNFRYVMPPRGWIIEDTVKARLPNGRLVLHQLVPNAWFAILVKDYRVRNPRPRELYEEGLYALEQYFKENLEHEYEENATFQDRPAHHLRFRGQLHKQTHVGDCYMYGNRGHGYWVLTWAAADGLKAAEDDFADLRKRFAFLDERRTWEEKRPALREFTASKSGSKLRDPEGIWEEAAQAATDFDPTAELVIHAREQDLSADADARRNARIAATILVLALPQAADLKTAVDAARAHVLERQKKDYPDTLIEPISDKDRPPEQAVAVGNTRGQISFLRVRNGESRFLFIVQAVVPRSDQVLVLQAECLWRHRQVWENVFQSLFQSLQVGN